MIDIWILMQIGIETGHRKLDGCIMLNEHNTVLGSKRFAVCATVYVGVQR